MDSNKFFISLPYVYPVCPLNINHARMFVIADIFARYYRYKGKNVHFSIASHYSGNTAGKISEVFGHVYGSTKVKLTLEEEKILNLFKSIYKTQDYVLRTFTKPLNILDYYSQEILWELKSLKVSCDYDYYYTTKSEDFSVFVNTIISLYNKNKLLVKNKEGFFALDYDNDLWKSNMLNLLEKVEFTQPFHKNNIYSAIKNVRNEWHLTKDNGYGVLYKNKLIIDPMFDSELFTIFDLYMRFKKTNGDKNINYDKLFQTLFQVLQNKKKSNSVLIKGITDWLPCDLFVAEEHLKNWIVKRLYAESLLLENKYQTKKYFILGMGLLNGKRMSASRGHAIFSKDLIDLYGSIKARLIIILAGGHPSKMYNYDNALPQQAENLINNFINYFTYIISIAIKVDGSKFEKSEIDSICDVIENSIKNGYCQKAVIELFSILPKKHKVLDGKSARQLLSVYIKYTDILLPGLLDNFNLSGLSV
jgi:leucyl-tRNA synthetase